MLFWGESGDDMKRNMDPLKLAKLQCNFGFSFRSDSGKPCRIGFRLPSSQSSIRDQKSTRVDSLDKLYDGGGTGGNGCRLNYLILMAASY
jgi:hypothetical protein